MSMIVVLLAVTFHRFHLGVKPEMTALSRVDNASGEILEIL
jgi:hypothetical protein